MRVYNWQKTFFRAYFKSHTQKSYSSTNCLVTNFSSVTINILNPGHACESIDGHLETSFQNNRSKKIVLAFHNYTCPDN